METTKLIALAESQLADLEAHVRALKAFIAKLNEQECTCAPDAVMVFASCREYLEEREMEF